MNRFQPSLKALAVLAGLAAALAAAPALRADGFIIPDRRPDGPVPPLSVKSHHVRVEIVGQVAKTSVDQVFLNHFSRDIEGTYIFPVPEGASVSDFAMFIGDERVRGEILDSREARRIYEDIVRRMRDPGLLEYMGRNLFRARVYPIPARGEKRVQISYTQVLKAENGLVRYLYPLNTERFSRDPIVDVSVSVGIDSPVPLVNVYSPSHKVSVRKDAEGRARVGYEEKLVRPDKDFVVYYYLSKDDVGLSFLSWDGPDGGYFMLLAAPRFAAAGERVVAKRLVLVLDSSGSMSGTKIRQAKEAARFIVNHLGRGDEFTLVDFDDGVSAFSDELVPATGENVDRALKFIEAIEDSGGTNINEALLAALEILGELGPSLGRPLVDHIEGSAHQNMKELRPGSTGRTEIRVLFAFDVERSAILLVGGDKSDDWKGWYRRNIPLGDQRFSTHQAKVRERQKAPAKKAHKRRKGKGR